MKKNIIIILGILVFLIGLIVFYSCYKNEVIKVNPKPIFMTEYELSQEQVTAIVNDTNFQNLLSISYVITDTLIKLGINDYTALLEMNSENFCNLIGISTNEYEELIEEIQLYATTLLNNHQLPNDTQYCSCGILNNSQIQTFNSYLEYWETNNSALWDTYNYYGLDPQVCSGKPYPRGNMGLGDPYNGGGGSGSGPDCRPSCYLCFAVCAATIEAFPLYLACCYLCMCSFCNNPPPGC